MDDDDKLTELLESLDIDKDQIYQIILSGGTELISEILPFNNKSKIITAINPLKILKEQYIEDGFLSGTEILTLYDSSMEVPILELNRNLIIALYKVDEEKTERYAYSLYDLYFPLDIEFEIEEKKNSKSKIKTNIISFLDYQEKRLKGIF